MRNGQREETASTDHKLFIYVGLGICALLLLLGMSLFCFLKRRRRPQKTVVFTSKDEAPPPYDAVIKKPGLNYSENMATPQPLDSFDNPIYLTEDGRVYQQQNNQNRVTDVVR